MSLFTRLLASLYPDHLLNQPGSPAGMFLGMISPQSFFNIITKKMAENYKMNRFDLTLDPFEVKIGFGEQSMIKPKAMQSYYSYCVAANLNGYQMYSVGSIATSITIMASYYLREIVNYPKQHRYLMHLLFALYVVAHVFAARLKEFPQEDTNQSYQWFIDLWFSYYQIILDHNSEKQPYDPLIVQQIKTRVLGQIELSFGLYRMMKHINHLLTSQIDRTYIKWLYERGSSGISASQQEVIDHIMSHMNHSHVDLIDYELIQMILPHDFSIKYFFGQQDIYSTIDYIVSKLYDYSLIDTYLIRCLDDNDAAMQLIYYLCDHHHMKDHFFVAAKELITNEIRDMDDEDEEVEEFMSMIGSGVVGKVPERLRRESMITERLMNFYLNYMGSLWTARGDTFALMLHYDISSQLYSIRHDAHPNSYELDLYRHYLTQYSVNAGYYHHVYQGVRSGKASFTLPYIIDSDEVYANLPMIDLLIQSSVICMMQDVLHKEIKLYPQSKSLLRAFKKLYGDRVVASLAFDKVGLVNYIMPLVPETIRLLIDDDMVAHMKESLYALDFHCYHDVLNDLIVNPIYQSKYHTHSSMLIAGTLRETVYGLLCMMALLQYQTKYSDHKSQELIQFLLTSYVIHVLGLQDTATMIICFDIIYQVYQKNTDLLMAIVQLDDNEEFMMMGAEFMNRFLKDKDDPVKAHLALLSEDVVWLRGYLKHINYYNKRYFIPQS